MTLIAVRTFNIDVLQIQIAESLGQHDELAWVCPIGVGCHLAVAAAVDVDSVWIADGVCIQVVAIAFGGVVFALVEVFVFAL